MGLFNFVSGWRDALIGKPLDQKMRETADVGREVALEHVHRITGYLASTISTEYRQSDRTVILHADAPYALIEATRGPTKRYQTHDYLTPACQAMGRVWGGSFEIHLPNAHVPESVEGKTKQIHAITGFHQSMGKVGRRTRVIVRRHRRYPDDSPDPGGLIL